MLGQLTSPNFVYRPSLSLRRTTLVRLSRLGARALLCSFLDPAQWLLFTDKIAEALGHAPFENRKEAQP